MFTRYLTGAMLLGVCVVNAQSVGAPDSLGSAYSLLEQYLDLSSADPEGESGIDAIVDLLEDPVDIKTASVDELQRIPGVDMALAQQIVDWRARQEIQSVQDLSKIPGITGELLSRIAPFLKVVPTIAGGRASDAGLRFRSRTAKDLRVRQGYRDGTYQGSNLKLYNRLDVRSSWMPVGDEQSSVQVSGGILAEKDPGESRINDFTSAFFVLQSSSDWRLLLGDFGMGAAQGLVFARGRGLGSTADVFGVTGRLAGKFVPYHSADENAQFRGIALSAPVGGSTVQVFYSTKRLNARVDSTGVITSFDAQGLFRTAGEQAVKGSSRENAYGLRLEANPLEGLSVGLNALETRFDNPVSKSALASIKGRIDRRASLDARYGGASWSSAAEVSITGPGDGAFVASFAYRPVRSFSCAIGIRGYEQRFDTYRGAWFSGVDKKGSAGGTYVAASGSITEGITLSGYYDVSRTNADGAEGRFASSGRDLLAEGKLRISSKVRLEIRYRFRSLPEEEIVESSQGLLTWGLRSRPRVNCRVTIDFRPSRNLLSRTRYEWGGVETASRAAGERGVLLSQEIRIGLGKGLTLETRFTAFDSDSYESRLYQFERDVEGAFSSPVLYGKGVRWYVLGRGELMTGLSVSAKYAFLSKEEVVSLYSGEDQVPGRQDSRLTVQLDLRF